MSPSYENVILEQLPKSILLVNTEKFDMAAQLAEVAMYLRQKGKNVKVIDLSDFQDFDVKSRTKLLHRFLVGDVPKKIHKLASNASSFEYKKYVCHKKVRFQNPFSSTKHFDSYEINALTRALRSKYSISAFDSKFQSEKYLVRQRRFFLEILKILHLEKPTHVIIFNGRFPLQTLVYLACRRINVPVSMHEGLGPKKFEIYRFSPHSPSDARRRIFDFYQDFVSRPGNQSRDFLQSFDLKNTEEFHDKLTQSFSRRQTDTEELPFSIAESVVYYTSSFYEYPSIPDFNVADPISQHFRHVRDLSVVCQELSLKLIVKVHPNPDAIRYEFLENEAWKSICQELGLDMIEATSKISTNKLIQNSFCNIVEGSSIGFDCVARGLPIIFLEETPWFQLEDIKIPRSRSEIKELLRMRPTYSNELTLPTHIYRRFGGFPYSRFRVDEEEIFVGDEVLVSRARFDWLYETFKGRNR